jgi:hypothetical protein
LAIRALHLPSVIYYNRQASRYLFTHSLIRRRRNLELDDYWKGLVVGMKVLPSQVDALVQVRWYWSKSDIEASIIGIKVDRRLKE